MASSSSHENPEWTGQDVRPLSSELDQADEASKAELAVARTKARGLELQAPIIEVQTCCPVSYPFFPCVQEEVLHLIFGNEKMALVRRLAPDLKEGWVPLESLGPVRAYDFLVKAWAQYGQAVGLVAEPVDLDHARVLVVIQILEDSILSDWNARCAASFCRDRVVPGDVILSVNGFQGQDMVPPLRRPLHILEMHVLRRPARPWTQVLAACKRRKMNTFPGWPLT
ncbi:unnamed protein product [Durusdinium trenchii]|uniref:PDZ domain-containing protein n=1 Tax=Durusdinium trenchii TaxID=1381693 RepID=A0ABP0L561_9DINO